MRVQMVRATVGPERRARYLKAWSEWSGVLFAMGVRTQLLESEEWEGEFVELTWFGEEDAAALGDDRLVRIEAELEAAALSREGALSLYRSVPPGG